MTGKHASSSADRYICKNAKTFANAGRKSVMENNPELFKNLRTKKTE
jgi:hypothetical protein